MLRETLKLDLKKRIQKLPPDKRRLFEKMLRQRFGEGISSASASGDADRATFPSSLRKGDRAAAGTEIPRRTTLTPAPSSFSQRRLWFLDQLETGTAVYNIPAPLRLEGTLDVDALAAALNAIVARHETLRTHFESENGEPLQVIAPQLELPLPLDDLSGIPEEKREAELHRRVLAEAAVPFDLARPPLLRARLLKVREKTHVLVLTLRHIISDGWSMGMLRRELSTLYAAFSQGESSPLPALPVQYADYAIWQHDRLQGKTLEKQLAYWCGQLKDLPVLDLPTDRPRPAVQNFRGAQVHFDLPAALTQRLEELSRRAGATLSITLLAAFQVLLQRHSGQDDIAVGSPIAARNAVELEGLIGFFVNTLVLRTNLSGNPTFMELLERVRETALSAYTHQELPFDKLVEELQPERDLSRNPLFQVMFTLHNEPLVELDLPGIRADLQPVQRALAKFDLTLSMVKQTSGLRGTFEYNTTLFDATAIERMARHFQMLLNSIPADPDQAIGQLSILSAAERQQLLVDWNNTACADGPGQLVHRLIEMQVDRTPASTAVGFESRTLSYQALDQEANQLAHHLQMLGVGPDVLVGVMLERSEKMLVALLGVLKAGGAYVPMDPDYPKARLAYMLEHSKVQVLLSEQAMLERLPQNPAQVVYMDRDRECIGEMAITRPATACRPKHLAYVIYTSGSTGKPKGVQIPHGAVVNFLNSMAQKPGISAQDVLLAGWQGSESFKILAGGEALPRDIVNQLIDRVGGVWNMYGPTETTVWSTCEYVTSKEGPILIGRPINNTRVHVLDKRMQPVPAGVPGELYIGGRGVARGYLNASELTQTRFVSDTFAKRPGERLYRTGDLVRYRPTGRLEYLARLDNQVKIRGSRIEIGEIEAVLSTHVAIKQSIVAMHARRPGDARLVAYIVLLPGRNITAAEVRGHLRRSLPDYMIPQHVLELKAVPLTLSGKIDRQALPSPFGAGALKEDTYVAPRKETEKALTTIWQDILGVDRAGIQTTSLISEAIRCWQPGRPRRYGALLTWTPAHLL